MNHETRLIPIEALTRGPGHHFFGYYDKSPWDASGGYILGMQVEFIDRPSRPDDTLALGMIDTAEDNRWQPLDDAGCCKTRASRSACATDQLCKGRHRQVQTAYVRSQSGRAGDRFARRAAPKQHGVRPSVLAALNLPGIAVASHVVLAVWQPPETKKRPAVMG
jgi:hypothetical protein